MEKSVYQHDNPTSQQVIQIQNEGVRKELDTRLDNCRRNILEMVSSSEIKLNELEDRIKVTDLALENQKVTENSHNITLENKLSDLRLVLHNLYGNLTRAFSCLLTVIHENDFKVNGLELFIYLKVIKAILKLCRYFNLNFLKNLYRI